MRGLLLIFAASACLGLAGPANAAYFLTFGTTRSVFYPNEPSLYMVPDFPTKAACEREGRKRQRQAMKSWFKPKMGKIIFECSVQPAQ